MCDKFITKIRCADYREEYAQHLEYYKYKPVTYKEACDIGVWTKTTLHSSDFHCAVSEIIEDGGNASRPSGFWLNAKNKIIGVRTHKFLGSHDHHDCHFTCAMELAASGRHNALSIKRFANDNRILRSYRDYFIKSPPRIRLGDKKDYDKWIAAFTIQKWWLKVKYNPHTYAGKKCFYQGGIRKELWSKEQVPIKYWSKEQLDEVNYTWG